MLRGGCGGGGASDSAVLQASLAVPKSSDGVFNEGGGWIFSTSIKGMFLGRVE